MTRLCSGILVLMTALLIAACGAGDEVDSSMQATPQSTATPAAAPPTTTPTMTAARPLLPATVTDKDGRSVTVTDVSRIIPLNGDIAEVIWALGLGDNVVATDTSATYPEAATTLSDRPPAAAWSRSDPRPLPGRGISKSQHRGNRSAKQNRANTSSRDRKAIVTAPS